MVQLRVPIPEFLSHLPLDVRGFPVPFFVADAKPGEERDLRVACGIKKRRAYKNALCWICGRELEAKGVFLGGPFSVVNRVFGDWASHHACAEFAVAGCPFLNGQMVRRRAGGLPDDLIRDDEPGFIAAPTPLTAFYVTNLRRVKMESKHLFFFVGPPYFVWWFKEGVRVADQDAQPVLAAARRKIEEEKRERQVG